MNTPNELAEDLRRVVVQNIADGTLELPSMRAAVLRSIALLGRDDFSFRQVAEIIEQDPVLVGRIVGVANSAAYGGLERAKTLIAAISRLGTASLRIILLEAAVNQVFESNDRRIAAACRGLWTHSRAVALLARDIAQYALVDDMDGAYLGGLLHDVGKPVIASLLVRSERRLLGGLTNTWFNANTWVELVQLSHRPVGVALARAWRLPETIASAIDNCLEYDDAVPRSASNCIRFANAIAKDLGVFVGDIDQEVNAGVLRVGQLMLGLENAEVNVLRDELSKRLAGDVG